MRKFLTLCMIAIGMMVTAPQTLKASMNNEFAIVDFNAKQHNHFNVVVIEESTLTAVDLANFVSENSPQVVLVVDDANSINHKGSLRDVINDLAFKINRDCIQLKQITEAELVFTDKPKKINKHSQKFRHSYKWLNKNYRK